MLVHRLSMTLGALLIAAAQASAADRLDLTVSSVIRFDQAEGTAVLPLFRGRDQSGAVVWYVVLDASDREIARNRGLNWAPKLANALDSAAVQRASLAGGETVFPGTVDFTPVLQVVPGTAGFPPAIAQPGSVGDATYSPLHTVDGRTVLNAPHIANASGLHDKVLAIDFQRRRVTLELTAGLYEGRANFYLSTEASDFTTAAIEGSTFAPNMNAAPGLGSNDPDSSARSPIIPVINGETGAGNPDRQGLTSAVLGEGSPLNILAGIPGRDVYSPLWDVHPAVWSDPAVAQDLRFLLDDKDIVADEVEEGRIVSGGTGPAMPDIGGLRAAGFIVNCPVIATD